MLSIIGLRILYRTFKALYKCCIIIIIIIIDNVLTYLSETIGIGNFKVKHCPSLPDWQRSKQSSKVLHVNAAVDTRVASVSCLA